jgi:hypothetical protein
MAGDDPQMRQARVAGGHGIAVADDGAQRVVPARRQQEARTQGFAEMFFNRRPGAFGHMQQEMDDPLWHARGSPSA